MIIEGKESEWTLFAYIQGCLNQAHKLKEDKIDTKELEQSLYTCLKSVIIYNQTGKVEVNV